MLHCAHHQSIGFDEVVPAPMSTGGGTAPPVIGEAGRSISQDGGEFAMEDAL